jgi:hypothetical protein
MCSSFKETAQTIDITLNATLSSDNLLKLKGPISSRTNNDVDGFSSQAYVATSINSRPALWRCLQPHVNKDVCFCTTYYECRKCEFVLTQTELARDEAVYMLCLLFSCWTVVAIRCTVPTGLTAVWKYCKVHLVPQSKHVDLAFKRTHF